MDWYQVTANLFKSGGLFLVMVVSPSSFPLAAPTPMLNTLNYEDQDVQRFKHCDV